jgi:hypothetical protein
MSRVMMRNIRLNPILSVFLALVIVAVGFCQYSGSIPVKASDLEDTAQSSAYQSGDEIVAERTETTKKCYLAENSYGLDISMGAIHYRDNYKNDFEQWKDIDLTFDKNNRITKAPYELTVDTENYAITIKDKKTGQISTLSLIKIGGKEIKNVQKPALISQGKVQWNDVDIDLDLAVTADNTSISFDWIVKSEYAPHQVEFDFQDGGIPVDFKGTDGERKSINVAVQKNGNVVIESIEKGGNYPKTINPDFQLAGWSRDCQMYWNGSAWEFYASYGEPIIGYYVSEYYKSGIGMSWVSTGIPSGATITSATIKVYRLLFQFCRNSQDKNNRSKTAYTL